MSKNNAKSDPIKKKRSPKVDTLTYIRQLDRYRWEFLRLSDQYRSDWEEFVADYLYDNGFYRRFCPDDCEDDTDCLNCSHLDGMWANPGAYSYHYNIKMDDWGVDSYYQNLTQKKLDTLMKYGIKAMPDPDHDYDEVMDDFKVCDFREKNKTELPNNFLFYTHLHEYGIYEGVYSHVDPNNSPFLTVTVNLTAHEDVATAFKKILRQRKKEMYKKEDKKLLRKKWSIPPNIHPDIWEKALEMIRLRMSGMNTADMAKKLFKQEMGRDYDEGSGKISEQLVLLDLSDKKRDELLSLQERIDTKLERYEFRVDNHLRKANAILRNVEQGILSDKPQPEAKLKK